MISKAALPLAKDGRVYHLNLHPDELADLVITVGDPKRVQEVSQHFDIIDIKMEHREFVTHTGFIGRQRLSVISTGIGTSGIDIVMHEVDALKNIDLTTRFVKKLVKPLTIVRMGTTGSVSETLEIGDLVISEMAVGLDNLLYFYQQQNNPDEKLWLDAFKKHMGSLPVKPYITSADAALVQKMHALGVKGVTVTSPGFYGPQGRVLRGFVKDEDILKRMFGFVAGGLPLLNVEMETAAILGLGKIMGHRCLSIASVVGNRVHGSFSANVELLVSDMIDKGLSSLV